MDGELHPRSPGQDPRILTGASPCTGLGVYGDNGLRRSPDLRSEASCSPRSKTPTSWTNWTRPSGVVNPSHDLAAWGCQPADVATRLMVAPCCGPRAYVCEGRARYYITVATIIQCRKCGRDWPNTRWAFPPL